MRPNLTKAVIVLALVYFHFTYAYTNQGSNECKLPKQIEMSATSKQ